MDKGVRMVIEKIIGQLLPFFPGVNDNFIKIEQDEYDEQSYEISDEVKGVPFLFLMLNNEGELDSFSVETDFFSNDKAIPKDKVLKKVNELIDVFIIPSERASLFLSAIIDLDEQWWIEFIRKDPYFGLELPNSGVSVRVEKNGIIANTDLATEPYQIEKPVITVSAEEAKSLFLEQLVLTPAIIKFDSDYIGGDDAYHLVYNVEDFVMSIGTDGELHTIELFGLKQAEYEELSPVKNLFEELNEVIGIPADFEKRLDKEIKTGRLEVWSDQPNLSSELEFEEMELIAGMLQIRFDEDEQIVELNYISEEEEKNSVIASREEALERAVIFLQMQYEHATDRFHLLREENRLFEYDEDGEDGEVYAYQFTFQRFERGVIVDNATISIEVDSRDLMITSVNADCAVKIDLSSVDVTCTFPVEQAKKTYENALEMERSWSREFDKDHIIYKLNYLPAFPETIGHMRAIDAKTGKPWIIDTSCIEEF